MKKNEGKIWEKIKLLDVKGKKIERGENREKKNE